MTMIERVARAIALTPFTRDERWSVAQARAAIAAMRKPTEAMIREGDPHTNCGGCCGNKAGKDTWQAMIDAALSLPPTPEPTPIVPRNLPS